MKESSRLRGLYAITDSKLLADGRLLPYVEAALKGAREIGFTIISITFSLIAVSPC